MLGLPADTDTVTIKVVAADGAADLDLTVLSTDFNLVYERTFGTGARDSVSVLLPAGTYVLAVTDYPGVPTAYDLCFTVNAPCTGLPATSASAGARASARAGSIGSTGADSKRRRPGGRFAGLPVAGNTKNLRGIPLTPPR